MKTLSVYLLIICAVLLGFYNSTVNAQTLPTSTEDYNTNAFISTGNFIDTAKATTDAEPEHVKNPLRPLKTFELYPNPANKIIYIHITGKQTVTLHNEEGKLIFRAAIREKATVNLTPLPAGNYILTDEKTGATKKFSIVR